MPFTNFNKLKNIFIILNLGEEEETAEEESKTKDMPDGAEDEKAKKAEKRKALVDNILDPNAAGPSAKKGRMDPFPQGAGKNIIALWLKERFP